MSCGLEKNARVLWCRCAGIWRFKTREEAGGRSQAGGVRRREAGGGRQEEAGRRRQAGGGKLEETGGTRLERWGGFPAK